MNYDTQPFIEQPSFEYIDMDVDNTVQTRVLNWVSDFINVQNLTPYPLYINWRTGAIPTPQTYETLVPAATEKIFAAVGNNFAFFLDIAGNTIPAVGKKCLITIQRGGIAPGSSEVNWRSSLNSSFNIAVSSQQSFDINVAGSGGLNINVELLSGSDLDVSVLIESSGNGVNYEVVKRLRLTKVNALFRSYPCIVNSFRITIINSNTSVAAIGIFTYSLTAHYFPIPTFYRTEWGYNNIALLANNNSLQAIVLTDGARIIDEIVFSFKTTTTPPFNFRIAITVSLDNGANAFISEFSNILIAIGGGVQLHGIGMAELTHCRLNEYAYRISCRLEVNENISVSLTNLSGFNLTDLNLSFRNQVEI